MFFRHIGTDMLIRTGVQGNTDNRNAVFGKPGNSRRGIGADMAPVSPESRCSGSDDICTGGSGLRHQSATADKKAKMTIACKKDKESDLMRDGRRFIFEG